MAYMAGMCHPDDIFPLVLTSATQELFGCRADEDVTGESPYKLLRKDDIVQDMKRRAAVSDFSTVKQIVLDYPEEEILLVFDRDFTYGQGFYLVLTPEAKEKILNPPLRSETETSGECEVYKTPEPKLWISLGSEQDIEEESVKESREKLKYKLSRVRRKFGTLVCFSDWNTADAKDGDVECASYSDSRFSIKQMERDCGIQAIPKLQSSSAQTQWYNQKNMCTQYEPRGFSEEEKESLVQSGSLKNFINSVTPRVLQSLQQNEIMDVFLDNWTALGIGAEEFDTGERANNLMVYQAFTDMQYSKDKTISSINWHPTISGKLCLTPKTLLKKHSEINTPNNLRSYFTYNRCFLSNISEKCYYLDHITTYLLKVRALALYFLLKIPGADGLVVYCSPTCVEWSANAKILI
uniref:WD repeat domain 63 n=1 Tax=Myripristis murdjan TaxID=586833 RepID=A0A668ARR9_9TELE